jgi:hypothetical protein
MVAFILEFKERMVLPPKPVLENWRRTLHCSQSCSGTGKFAQLAVIQCTQKEFVI